MTVALAVRKDGIVYVGADNICHDNNGVLRNTVHPKVFYVNRMLLATTGTIRLRQVLMFHLDLTGPLRGQDPYTYLCTEVSPRVRQLMKENGQEVQAANNTLEMDGRILFVVHNRIFLMDSGYGILESSGDFESIGCAAIEAKAAVLGASLVSKDLNAYQLVEVGLQAASELDINIRPPFTIIKGK